MDKKWAEIKKDFIATNSLFESCSKRVLDILEEKINLKGQKSTCYGYKRFYFENRRSFVVIHLLPNGTIFFFYGNSGDNPYSTENLSKNIVHASESEFFRLEYEIQEMKQHLGIKK